jgi:flagellar motor switch protein FliM
MEQGQIDQLLGLAGERGDAPSLAGSERLEVYDFRRPHRVSKERIRTLEVMYERLVKSLEGWLTGRVRGPIELRLQSVSRARSASTRCSWPRRAARTSCRSRTAAGIRG